MIASHVRTEDLEELKDYVYQTLCDHEQLERGVFPMTARLLRRRAGICGMFFCLHGPRSVKFTAVWETDRNTILFYGATGERFLKLHLTAAPPLPALP